MYKIIIIGAGAIGLSIARAISENSKDSVLIIEKAPLLILYLYNLVNY